MITRFFKKIYRFIDKYIVVPISRAVYYLSKKYKKNQGKLDKILNRPNFLIYLSLIIAVGLFLLIDSKVITLVETEAEVITNVPVVVNYNEEAYVVEGVPETVDITLTGRKSDIYLAKQLGEYEVILDLSDYKPGDTPYKVYFTYSKSIDSLSYRLSPEYVQVTIKNKESLVKSIDYDLLNIDALDSKLSVESVTLDQSEVVVKGGSDALEAIASVKALIDLEKQEFTEAGTYDIDNVELVAYDSSGAKLDNVEIVPKTISATVVLDSYSKTVPLAVQTTGKLVTGKAIASILINNNTSYSITIYGDEDEIESIESIPVTIDVSDMGNESTKTYKVNIKKPNGVRDMSVDSVEITTTFGEEEQKTIVLKNNFTQKNIASGLTANPISGQEISVQVKGVASVIEDIEAEDIQAYIDLAGLGVGDYEVEVKINNKNPLVNYVVSNTLQIRITEN
ncbi:MAG: YbbR-like domain-containing protein [Bacilli bacterium]